MLSKNLKVQNRGLEQENPGRDLRKTDSTEASILCGKKLRLPGLSPLSHGAAFVWSVKVAALTDITVNLPRKN